VPPAGRRSIPDTGSATHVESPATDTAGDWLKSSSRSPIAAELPLLTACLLATFGRTPVTSYTPLVLPIAIQEYVLAAWLIFKGFTPGATQPGTLTGQLPSKIPHATQ
jgi:hypothetical protein